MSNFPFRVDHGRRRALAVLAAAAMASLAGRATGAGPATPAIGTPLRLPDTQLLDGKLLRASDLAGKVVLVKFWATWCPICVAEMPALQRFYAAHRGRGFEALALSLDFAAPEVELFWDGSGYTFASGMNTPAHKEVFGQIFGTPTFFLLDRQGVLRQRVLGAFSPPRMDELILPLLRS